MSTMKETAIIEFDVRDRDVLMTIFERFKVVFKSKKTVEIDEETLVVKRQLHTKYVETGIWNEMNDEERMDAAHAETLIFRKEYGEYNEKLSDEETEFFLTEMASQLADIAL
jgi:hypothetical protein